MRNLNGWLIAAFLSVILLGFSACQFKFRACLEEGFSRNYCVAFVMR